MHDELLARTRELIAGCECENGCPTCVGPIGNTGPLAKTRGAADSRSVRPSTCQARWRDGGARRMTSLSDRLRGVIASGGLSGLTAGPASSDAPAASGRPDHDTVADVLGGEWHERGGQRFLVVDRTYVPGYRHGSMALADGLPPPTASGRGCRCSTSCAPAHWRTHRRTSHLLFIDLETTGLAGGAGTYAFLVGCGWFRRRRRSGSRQFFLSSFTARARAARSRRRTGGECGHGRHLQRQVVRPAADRDALRAAPAATPFAELPHIDMLHPARRMWRGRPDIGLPCSHATLEQTLCGYVREGDVAGVRDSGALLPLRAHRRSRPLAAVLEHNRLDLLSLALRHGARRAVAR